jgi:hypothetical protein
MYTTWVSIVLPAVRAILRLRKVATKVRQASPFTELAGALSGGVMPLAAAIAMPNRVLRGRDDKAK